MIYLRVICVERLYCKRPILCLASSKILTPHPRTTRRVCTPCLWGGRRTHSLGGEGVGVNILEDARHSSVLYICKYFESSICIEWVSLGRLILLWQAPVMWREIRKKSTYQHWISSGSRVDKIQMQCHCCIFFARQELRMMRTWSKYPRRKKNRSHCLFKYLSRSMPSNLTPTLFPGWFVDIYFNPIWHTEWLCNLSRTLKNNTAKYFFGGENPVFCISS